MGNDGAAASGLAVPEVVRNKAMAAGAAEWLEELPDLIAGLEHDWSITVGRSYDGGTEAHVVRARLDDGTPAVLKLMVPRSGGHAEHEITVLRLAGGEGCVRLLRDDAGRGALLLERLGPSMHDLALPIDRRLELLCSAAARLWRPAPGGGLPTGADKGRWLVDFITTTWTELDRPCSERAVDHALACAARRIEAHDDERAALVHGDVHQWNALESDDGFKLIDPDGLVAEAEYDLGILLREDPDDLLDGTRGEAVLVADAARRRASRLAAWTGLDPDAILDWGIIERVSTGLLCTRIDLQPVGRELLTVADLVAG